MKDVLRVVISDTHSGSNTALFLNRHWRGLKTSHVAMSIQVKIREQFEKFADEVKRARKGKRVELIHNGDAVDGDHHHSGDVCTINVLEQADIHIELMLELQKRIQWQAGDKMYYTKGTPVHVGDYEDYIAKEMNAVPEGEFYVWNLLDLTTNGTRSWFVHHGKGRGDGANEGNAVRNWLRSIHFDALKDKHSTPDVIYTGHVHDPTYSNYVYRDKMVFKMLHGIILPSWQAKTSYAYMRAPISRNKIGGVYHEISAAGKLVMPPEFSIMETGQ